MAAQLSTGKKLVFGLIIAVAVSVVGVLVLELVLRVAGYGHASGFFVERRDTDAGRYLRENRWVTARYFPPELIRRPQSIRLRAKKQAGTYRVFVLGSSAAMGDPEPAFSLARQLEVLLTAAYPEVKFEVVNVAITAINSHVVRAIAQDCAEQAPDLFIVYEGNNEVIGPFGPGTVFSPFLQSGPAIRSATALKATRVGQGASALLRRVSGADRALEDWGGMQMFLKNEIAYGDPRLDTTMRFFGDNLRAITRAGREAGASVFLCTVLTNQRDFPPFVSRHRAGLSDAQKAEWQRELDGGRQLAAAGDLAGAEARLRAALAIDDAHAGLHFELGQLCLAQKKTDEARTFFQAALDRDCLRFRTDSRLNQTVRETAQAAGAGVELVDLAAELPQSSPGGIAGDELLYEHVHLNFQGTYLAARNLFTRISSDLEKRGVAKPPAAATEPMPINEVRQRLAYTTYEQAMIIEELQARFGRAPFTAQARNDERLKLYAARGETARRMLARSDVRAQITSQYERALEARPSDWLLRRNAGMALLALGQPAQALEHLKRAAAWIDDDADTLFALAKAQEAQGDAEASRKSFEAVRRLEPRYPGQPDAASRR